MGHDAGVPTAFLCVTCGTQYPPADEPPAGCPICLDERQYVPPEGQRWTTLEELRRAHRSRLEEEEPGLLGIGVEPSFAIGQRALLVESLLWDCTPFLDDDVTSAVETRGGISTIAISHPHYYTTMGLWADRFDARILVHEDDREWVLHPSPRVELWSGERLRLSDALELVRLGGHFAGGQVCVWRDGADGRGVLLAGDLVQVVPDRDWVSFMWSYPNLIPLPAREVRRIRAVVETLRFDRLYAAWWGRVVGSEACEITLRSADRYVAALER